VAVSALHGDGIGDLLQTVKNRLYESYEPVLVELPYNKGELISLFHEEGHIEQLENKYQGVFIQGRIPLRHVAKYKPYLIEED
jgi:GTP-binding protein HflX